MRLSTAAASVFVCLLCLSTARAEPLAGSRPNVILIMTDDQGLRPGWAAWASVAADTEPG